MKIRDCIAFSLKTLKKNKHSKYIFILFLICTVLLISGLIFRDNFYNYVNNTITKNIGFRSVLVSPLLDDEDYGLSKIKKLENVVDVYGSNYDFASVLSDFKNTDYDGYIDLNYGTSSTLPRNIIGEKIETGMTGVAICPINFYPSSAAVSLGIDKSKILNGYSLLNTTFKVTYYSYKFDGTKTIEDQKFEKEFKIIGLYNNEEVMTANNVCYVSSNDVEEINNVGILEESMDSTVYGFIVVVDSKDNVEKVINELSDIGFFQPTVKNKLDTSLVQTILLTCNVLITIVMFGIIVLSIFYTKKNIINNSKKIALMRAIGFGKINIRKYYFVENFLLNFIAFSFGLLFFIIIYLFLKLTLLEGFIYSGFYISIYIYDLVFVFLVVVVMTSIISVYYISKLSKKSISLLLNGDDLNDS